MADLQVGLELDTAVAERVMNWRREPLGGREYWTQEPLGTLNPKGWAGPPPYSTTILYAWKIVDRLRAAGLVYFVLSTEPDGHWDLEWTTFGSNPPVPPRGVFAHGATVPEVICRAALVLPEQAADRGSTPQRAVP